MHQFFPNPVFPYFAKRKIKIEIEVGFLDGMSDFSSVISFYVVCTIYESQPMGQLMQNRNVNIVHWWCVAVGYAEHHHSATSAIDKGEREWVRAKLNAKDASVHGANNFRNQPSHHRKSSNGRINVNESEWCAFARALVCLSTSMLFPIILALW